MNTYACDIPEYTQGLIAFISGVSRVASQTPSGQGPMKKSNSSMQLTRAADYAVRVMIHLVGLPSNHRVSLVSIAAVTGAPESFLSKVLQALAHAHLIFSQRGQTGGFEIALRGRRASMLEVIEAIDGPIRLNLCLTSGKSCVRKGWCPAHLVWQRAQAAMTEVLAATRIADLAASVSSVSAQAPGASPAAVSAPACAAPRASE